RWPRAAAGAVCSHLRDRTHLYGAEARARDTRRGIDGLVERGAVDEVIAADELLRLGERAIGDEAIAVAHAHGVGLARASQRVAVDEDSLFADRGRIGEVLAHDRIDLLLAHPGPGRRVVVDQ